MMIQMSSHCIFILEYVVKYASLVAILAKDQLIAQLTTEDSFAVGSLQMLLKSIVQLRVFALEHEH